MCSSATHNPWPDRAFGCGVGAWRVIHWRMYVPDHAPSPRLPAYAARLLEPDEAVRYRTRPRAMGLGLRVALGAILGALATFSVLVEPGFIRLAILPALPLVGTLGGHWLHSPVIFVTTRRVVYAGRWLRPLSIDLARLKAVRIQQGRVERRLGYGRLLLLVTPLEDLGEDVFVRHEFARLPDAAALAAALGGERTLPPSR